MVGLARACQLMILPLADGRSIKWQASTDTVYAPDRFVQPVCAASHSLHKRLEIMQS